MLAWVLELERRLVARTLHPSDTDQERFLWPIYGGIFFAMWYATLVIALTCAVTFLYVWFTRQLPIRLVEVFLIICVHCTVACDWSNAAARMPRVWPWIVLIMDVMLAVGIRNAVQFIVLGVTISWVTLSAVEEVLRLGLYDIPYWSEADPQYLEDACSCSDPPCALAPRIGLIAVGNAMFPLLLDYGATRSFATGMQTQTDRLVASVELAEQIAESLALFDLGAASESLETHRDNLPSVLCDCFEKLLHNLASYRPYLPQSCLAGAAAQQDEGGEQLESEIGRSFTSALRPEFLSVLASVRARPAGRRGSLASAGSSRRSSRTSLVSAPGEQAAGPTKAMNAPQPRRLALLHCNRSGLLSVLGSAQVCELSAFLTDEVAVFAGDVTAQKGIVDLLSADHLSASFGAIRALGSHRAAAVRCGMALASRGKVRADCTLGGALAALPTTAAACSGKALCGDFGSAAAQRFMVVGCVSALAAVAERVAAAWGVQLLIDDFIRDDTEADWDSRLRAKATFPKCGSSAPFGLWDVVQAKEVHDADCVEWMYELQAAAPNPWEPYNRAVELWCKKQWEEARQMTRAAGQSEAGPASGSAAGQVRASLAMLSAAVSARQDPPVGALRAVQVADPAPVGSSRASQELVVLPVASQDEDP